MVQLSRRMRALADAVTSGGVLADVGTDHCFVPIALCQEGRISSAIAMDVHTGPLSTAREHICEAGLLERIELRQSDGLAGLSPGEADTILMAGMGGGLMQRILKEGETTAASAGELVLQPQSEIPEFRRFLTENRYVFLDEDAVFEDGKYYFLMRVRRTNAATEDPAGDAVMPESALELAFGAILLQKRHPVLWDYLCRERLLWERNLSSVERQGQTPRLQQRSREIQARLALLTEAIERFGGDYDSSGNHRHSE